MSKFFSKTIFSAIVFGSLILASNVAQTNPLPQAKLNTSIGDGVREDVQFALPDEGPTPQISVGAGVR